MKTEKIAFNIYYMTNVSFSIYDNDAKVYETNALLLPETLRNEIEEDKLGIVIEHKDNKIYRVQTNYDMTYLSIYANNRNILLGPFLINDDYEQIIDRLILSFRLISEEAEMIENFYHGMKILSETQQNMFINCLVLSDNLNENTPRIYNVHAKRTVENDSQSTKSNDYTLKNIENNIEIEEMLLSIVRNGDVESAQNLDFQKISNQHIIYKNNSFTNMKTNLMIFDALCNREAIKAGVDKLLAYKISNNIKFHIHKLSVSSELKLIAQKILTTYSKAVKEYTLLNYSNNIRKIILFVRKNLTKSFSLDDVAKELFITKEHLSRLFKKEVGITISEYIIKSKIEEAKSLLRSTDYNILNIATLLNFANSSHFSNSFKKVTGISPSDYRKRPSV